MTHRIGPTAGTPSLRGRSARRAAVAALAALAVAATAQPSPASAADDTPRTVTVAGTVAQVFVHASPGDAAHDPDGTTGLGGDTDDHAAHDHGSEDAQPPAPGEVETVTMVEVDGRLLDVPASEAAGLIPNQEVEVTVTASADAADEEAAVTAVLEGEGAVADVEATEPAAAVMKPEMSGPHTLTVLPVYWSAPDRQTQQSLANLAAETATYWTEQTGGQLTMAATARDWARIPDPGSCDAYAIYNSALSAHGLAAPASHREHVLVYFPRRADCSWAGLGQVRGPITWLNGYATLRESGHEIGHNLGLGHAGSLRCTDGAGVQVVRSTTCSRLGYGDRTDVMGGNDAGNLNTAFADHLGVLEATTVRPGTRAVVDLAPVEQVDAHRAVRIPLGTSTLYVELRRNARRDVIAGANWAGVQIRERLDGQSYPDTRLLDLKPELAYDHASPSMSPAMLWRVPEHDVVIAVRHIGADSARVDIRPAGSDATAPRPVSVTSPRPGAVTSTVPAVAWSESDDAQSGVAAYRVVVDGTPVAWTAADTLRALPPAPLSEGAHTVRVDAVDAAGNAAVGTPTTFTASASAGAPAEVTSPSWWKTVSGPFTVSWSRGPGATEPEAYRVLIDGTVVATAPGTSRSALVTDLPADGGHELRVDAVGSDGGAVTGRSSYLRVHRSVPSAPRITSPTEKLVAGPAVEVEWEPTVDSEPGVQRYEILLDGHYTGIGSLPADARSAVVHNVYGEAVVTVVGFTSRGATSWDETTVRTDPTPPTAPVVTAPRTGWLPGTATISWSAAQDAESGIATQTVLIDGVPAAEVAGLARSAVVSLSAGWHRLEVTAVNGVGWRTTSDRIGVMTDTVAPRAARPAVRLRAGDGRAGVPVSVSTTATDDSSGMCDLTLTAGGRAVARAQSGFLADTVVPADRATVYGRTARDCAGNAAVAAQTTVTPQTVTENGGTYAGAWKTAQATGLIGGVERRTTQAGAKVSFTFTGSQVAWVGTRSSRTGVARVYLDGRRVATIDTVAGTRAYRQVLWARRTTRGTHTVTIVNAATSGRSTVTVDGFFTIP